MFRREVFEHRRQRLMGEVIVATPPSWKVISGLLVACVIVAFIFLYSADYTRFETVRGTIVPDSGVAAIVPLRPGVITEIKIREGDQVPQGSELLTVRAEEDGPNGLSSAAQAEVAVRHQDAGLSAQMNAVSAAQTSKLRQIETQAAGLTAEIEQLDGQIEMQKSLVWLAQDELDGVKGVAERGFISRRDLNRRREELISRQQMLSQLVQLRASKATALLAIDRSRQEVQSDTSAQISALSAARAQVAQQGAVVSGARSYVLRAPVPGKIAAMVAKVGQPVDARSPVMSIVPNGSSLQAQLMVTPSAIGFVKPGQTVRLAIDAYPYQRFGTTEGTIQTVSASPISVPTDVGILSAYPVTVKLRTGHILAYGRQEQLLPGMTLSARIAIQKQSLLEWLFEPLFAVRAR